MIADGRYFLGTAKELAEYVLNGCFPSDKDSSTFKIRNMDFAIADEGSVKEELTLDEIKFNSDGKR